MRGHEVMNSNVNSAFCELVGKGKPTIPAKPASPLRALLCLRSLRFN